jgi:YfiH family protein
MVADCLPVLFYDPQKKITAAVHAGWRGIASGIVQKTLRRMNGEWHSLPSAVHAFIGPAAGECCYEIGAETANRFKKSILMERNRRLYLNLKEGVRLQLLDEGVRPMNIEMRLECTICNTMFHSYRRDGKRSGRMMAIIGRTN